MACMNLILYTHIKIFMTLKIILDDALSTDQLVM